MFSISLPASPTPEFLLQVYEPACLQSYRRGEIAGRVELAVRELEDWGLSM